MQDRLFAKKPQTSSKSDKKSILQENILRLGRLIAHEERENILIENHYRKLVGFPEELINGHIKRHCKPHDHKLQYYHECKVIFEKIHDHNKEITENELGTLKEYFEKTVDKEAFDNFKNCITVSNAKTNSL